MSPVVDLDYAKTILLKLLNTPSPTGNTVEAIKLVDSEFTNLGLTTTHTIKGSLLATFPGKTEQPAKIVSAHVDTLGGIVKEIKSNGRLVISSLGGYYSGSIVGEYCTVETASGQKITGTVLIEKQSVHIHRGDEIHNLANNLSNLEVRLDARTTSKKETLAMGIQVGDFINWDPRAQVTDTGFIKSRHLDDKASVAIILATVKSMQKHNLTPQYTTHFYITTYEEVGHGASGGLPATADELLAIDIGVLGIGQEGSEFGVMICAKDGGGPYDLQLRRKLVSLAQDANIDYYLDVLTYYGSDGTAALRAGAEMRVGLIGPGVDSTHAYERTHTESILNTTRLLIKYLQAN